MRVQIIRFLAVVFVASLLCLAGCTPPTPVRISQPWTRVLDNEQTIPAGATVAVTTRGKTAQVPGDEDLYQNELTSYVEDLLIRRGFSIGSNDSSYTMHLVYSTDRLYSDKGGSLSLYGKTHDIAHALSLEIQSPSGLSIWQGDSVWESSLLNGIRAFRPSIHLLLSELPHVDGHWPSVDRVKLSRWASFFTLYCKNEVFSSPALPYRIRFREVSSNYGWSHFENLIDDKFALHAYYDLLLNAEFAVPTGSDNYLDEDVEYVNVRHPKLWTSVLLAGKYHIGESGELFSVMIWLKATGNDYIVDRCAVVAEAEYDLFVERQEQWHESRRKYYDFYE